MNFLIAVAIALSFAPTSAKAYQPAELRFSPDCILEAVAKRKRIVLKAGIARPQVIEEKHSSLEEFQNATEAHYGFRMQTFANVYVPGKNIIFVTDNPANMRHGRTLDDVLAHEYTHYLQSKYEGLTDADGSMDWPEDEAVRVQNWFRETFMAEGSSASPC